MNKILEIHGKTPVQMEYCKLMCTEADSDVVVQSGLKWDDLNTTLAEKGIPLFFPVGLPLLLGLVFTVPLSWTLAQGRQSVV